MNRPNLSKSNSGQASRLKKLALPLTLLYARLTKRASGGDQLTAPTSEGLNLSNTVQFIKDLPLRDFITCNVHKDYSVLGKGTKEELEAAYHQLLSQYYEARQAENVNSQMQMVWKIESLRFRAKFIACVFTVIETRYNEQIAQILRELFPTRKFTEETYIADMKYVANVEKLKELEYLSLKTEFENQQKNAKPDKGKATEEGYYESVMAYNEAFKTSHSVDKLNTLEYALMTKRLSKHYAALKQQNMKHGSR